MSSYIAILRCFLLDEADHTSTDYGSEYKNEDGFPAASDTRKIVLLVLIIKKTIETAGAEKRVGLSRLKTTIFTTLQLALSRSIIDDNDAYSRLIHVGLMLAIR